MQMQWLILINKTKHLLYIITCSTFESFCNFWRNPATFYCCIFFPQMIPYIKHIRITTTVR